MFRKTRKLWLVVGAFTILALAFGAIGPVLAQEDGTTYTTQEGDTLGAVLDQAGIDVGTVDAPADETHTGLLREFFDLNPDLAFAEDAQVTVPEGIAVTGQEPVEGETLTTASFVNTYGLTDDEGLRQFVVANENLELVPAQTVQFPAGAVQAGDDAAAEDTTDATAEDTTEDTAGQTGDDADQAGDTSTYTVAAGDTLESIANQYEITVEELITLNPDLVQPGDTLVVPAEAGDGQVPGTGTDDEQQGQAGDETGDQTDDETAETGEEGIPQTGPMLSPWGGSPDIPGLNLGLNYDELGPGQGIYIVQGGDSLSSIATRFGLTVPELWAMNPTIENPNVIYSGQRIRVTGGGENVDAQFATQDELDRQLELASPDNSGQEQEEIQ